MARLKEDAHGATSVADVNEEKFDWHWVRMAFKAPQTWLSSLIWFFLLVPLYVRPPQQRLNTLLKASLARRASVCCYVNADITVQSFSLFLPTIITGLGYTSTTTAQLFTVPPNLAAFITVLITSLLSDRIRARGPIMAAGIVVAIAGYIMLLVAKRAQVRYGGTFLVAAGVYPCSAMIMVSWQVTGQRTRPVF